MTDLCQHDEQQTKLTEHTPILTRSEMPSIYSSTRHRPFINKNLTDHDDDDPDSVYKEAFIIQIFQHWKIKTLEHQHAVHNSANTTTSNRLSQTLVNTVPSVETPNAETISNETLSNDNDDDAPKPITTMQKRAAPLSHARRAASFKRTISMPVDISNPNLLTPYTKFKCGTTTTTTIAKKPAKLTPIFIAPRKTQPPPLPRLYSCFSFDESAHVKRKATLEKQNALGDDQLSPPWAPAPPTTPTRFLVQSPGSSLDDDETSSDENSHESLLIRGKKNIKKTKKTKEKHLLSIHSNLIIPTAIFITDPHGHSRVFDLNNDNLDEFANTERIIDDDFIQMNSLDSNGLGDYSSSSGIVIIPPTSGSNVDKYALHSIGEEGEEESAEKENNDGIILSKALNRIEAFTRSRQTISYVEDTNTNTNINTNHYERRKMPLGRRWSDGFVSDDEEHIRSTQSPLIKMASATSIMKQPVTPPVKLSKTKYLLMKLHLTPSPYKDDESNISSISTSNSSSRKRTVRRSSDKKHSEAKLEILQPSVAASEQTSNISRQESLNTLVSTNKAELQPKQRLLSATNTIATTTTTNGRKNRPNSVENRGSIRASRTASVGTRESNADSDDDIDGTFEKAKLGSQSSINSALSESKARYDLDISGTIELKLSYNIQIGSLDIFIQKCTDLARAKRNQTSNPYCKSYLLPDQSKTSKLKTTVKKHTTDPEFGERLRYHLSSQEFNSRIIWISVWSQTSLGHNDFLGEIHIPLASCKLDTMEEYTLLPRVQPDDVMSTIESTVDSNELHFYLTFIENPKNKELGTIQIERIEGKGIYHGKQPVDAICKGLLMPDKIKRKLPTTRKGPSPKWDIPLRWENIRRNNLTNTSIEISIWCQERFRKTMIGFIRLDSSQGHNDVKSLETTKTEQYTWESFLKDPTKTHHCQLPLRPATNEK